MTETKPTTAPTGSQPVASPVPVAESERPKPTRQRIIDAVKLKDRAASHQRWADHKAKSGDCIGALSAGHDAEQMRKRADADLTRWAYTTRNRQPPGNGGELVPLPEPEDAYRRDWKRMAVEELPDVLEHQASSDAMNLVTKVDVLPLALEMANSVKAKNRAEKFLAHQAVTMHTLAMKFAERAINEIDRANSLSNSGQTTLRQIANTEASRANNAAARAMNAFNDAMLTLLRLRTGGKQEMVVVHQHVAVADGGKAVVAGNLKTKGRGSNGKGVKSK